MDADSGSEGGVACVRKPCDLLCVPVIHVIQGEYGFQGGNLTTAIPGEEREREGGRYKIVCIKKSSIYRLYNGTGNIVSFLFPFNFHAVAVLVLFQTFPVLS